MAKKTKTTGKGRLDKYYHLAKEQGFRSRAAFKLIQLNKKYNFLAGAHSLLDLCAAPGSWMQVATKNMPVSSLVVGVDLAPIRPIQNCVSLVEDITTAKCRAAVRKYIGPGTCDVVLHDGAPNVGQSWTQDAYTQSELVIHSCKLATEFLRQGGVFITKVFRSQDYNALLWVFQQLFTKVEATKPLASRNSSAEIFVVCDGYRAPRSIDPKLLDPKHVFKFVDMPSKPQDVFSKKMGKRKRDGYDEQAPISMFMQCPVHEFIVSETPVAILAKYNALVFQGQLSDKIKASPATTEDVQVYCQDLKVLGKKEFKELLKWRMQVREYVLPKESLSEADEDSAGDDTAVASGAQTAEDEEAHLAAEYKQIQRRLVAKQKAAKRKDHEKKAKYQKRIDLKMILPDDRIEQTSGDGLFSLSTMKSKSDLIRISNEMPAGNEEGTCSEEGSISDDQDDAPVLALHDGSVEEDDDGALEKYNTELDKYFTHMYENAVETKASRSEKKKLSRRKEEAARAEEAIAADVSDLINEVPRDYVPDLSRDPLDNSTHEIEGNPLLVGLGKGTSSTDAKASLWFSQSLFAGAEEEPQDSKTQSAKRKLNSEAQCEDSQLSSVSRPNEQKRELSIKPGMLLAEESGASSSSDMESEPREEDYDSDEKNDILGMGTLLKTHNVKAAQEAVDDAYNRFAFADRELMPSWFAEEERKFSVRQVPLSKEVMSAIRARVKAIDARPIKKVAEAKARKRRRATQALEKMKKKASSIADASDLSEKAKARAIDKLYKAGASKVRSGHLKVLKRDGKKVASGGKSKTRLVDARLKKDKLRGGRKNTGMKAKGTGKRSRTS